MGTLRLIILLTCLLSPAASAAGPAAAPSSLEDRPSLLLITLDTTRADHIGSYGYRLPTSPNLDRLAEGGVRFANAYAQIPLTGPSHATILTGLYPHEHGAVRNGVPLPEKVVTLAERLQDAGYRTGAFLSGWTLRANLSGLAQGFDVYDDRMEDRYNMVNSQRFAHQVTPPAVDWLQRNADAPFFLWVHYFDPHAPYTKQDAFYDILGGTKPRGMPSRTLKYDSEIHEMDAWIGRLLDALDGTGAAQNTVVVAAADHGESLGEHGYVGHGQYLYEEILRVPLVLSWPGRLPADLSVEAPVALLDLAPTLLHLLRLPSLDRTEGINLVPLMKGREAGASYASRQIRFELYPGARKKFFKFFASPVTGTPTMAGYVEGHFKVVHHMEAGTAVYDLSSAKGEDRDVSKRHPGLQARAQDLVAWVESTTVAIAESELSEEDAERLKSLGYND